MAETKPVRLSLISAYGQGKRIIIEVWDQPFFLVHVEINANHMCLFSAILPCPYGEIRAETKPVRLSLISAYGQGKMI
jgi:hypothetical protein